jgi:hypothetical protein
MRIQDAAILATITQPPVPQTRESRVASAPDGLTGLSRIKRQAHIYIILASHKKIRNTNDVHGPTIKTATASLAFETGLPLAVRPVTDEQVVTNRQTGTSLAAVDATTIILRPWHGSQRLARVAVQLSTEET